MEKYNFAISHDLWEERRFNMISKWIYMYGGPSLKVFLTPLHRVNYADCNSVCTMCLRFDLSYDCEEGAKFVVNCVNRETGQGSAVCQCCIRSERIICACPNNVFVFGYTPQFRGRAAVTP